MKLTNTTRTYCTSSGLIITFTYELTQFNFKYVSSNYNYARNTTSIISSGWCFFWYNSYILPSRIRRCTWIGLIVRTCSGFYADMNWKKFKIHMTNKFANFYKEKDSVEIKSMIFRYFFNPRIPKSPKKVWISDCDPYFGIEKHMFDLCEVNNSQELTNWKNL